MGVVLLKPESKKATDLEGIIANDKKKQAAHIIHLHQPPSQSDEWIYTITGQCYLPLTELLATSDFPAAVNITSSLLQHFVRLRIYKPIEYLAEAAEQGKIELTGTGANHPILPDLYQRGGESEVKRQIELNHKFQRAIFTDKIWKPRGFIEDVVWKLSRPFTRKNLKLSGFFPAEMAFSPDVASIIKEMGYEYAVIDAVSFDAVHKGNPTIPYNYIGVVNGLPVLFRSGKWSNELTLEMPTRRDYDMAACATRMKQGLDRWFSDGVGYIVVACDGEAFGHHVPQYTPENLRVYRQRLQDEGIALVLPSKLLEYPRKEVSIKPASWSTSLHNIERENKPFPMWSDPDNPVHNAVGKITEATISIVHQADSYLSSHGLLRRFLNYRNTRRAHKLQGEARQLTDEGLCSCTQWNANPSYGKWNPMHIKGGANRLLGAAYKGLEAIELVMPSGAMLRVNGYFGNLEGARTLVQSLEQELNHAVSLHK